MSFFYAAAASSGGALATDDFNSYTNGQALGDQANWDARGGVITCTGASGIYPDSALYGCAAYTAGTTPADMRSELTITTLGGLFTTYIGVAVRIQAGSDTYYGVFVQNGNLYVYDVLNGANYNVIYSDTSFVFASGNKIALEAVGTGASTRLRVQKDVGAGWVDVATNLAGLLTLDGGYAGVCGIFSGNSSIGDDWQLWNAPQ